MSKPNLKISAFKMASCSRIMFILLIYLNLCFWSPAQSQSLSKSDLNAFETSLLWEIKTNQGASAIGFGAMQNVLIKMEKNPTPVEVMAALETVCDNATLFDRFLYECVFSQKGNKSASQQLFYAFCKNYGLALRCYSYVQSKFGKRLESELKTQREKEEKERIEYERKQKLEEEKARIVEEERKKDEEEENKIYEKPDLEAKFPGSDSAWRKYLERNLNPSVPVDNGAPEGTYTVYVQFVVSKDGSVSNVTALTNHGYGMESEAVRVIKRGPAWVPAIWKGRNVKAYCKQSIIFGINSN